VSILVQPAALVHHAVARRSSLRMHLPQRNCRRVTPLTLGGIALGLAVAIWGAGYKMAQYPHHGCAFRIMAPAKLLTEKERPGRTDGLWNLLPTAAGQRLPLRHLPALIACSHRSAPQARQPGALASGARQRKTLLPELTYFSFRPPPRLFTS
jgi:hypothetical protein